MGATNLVWQTLLSAVLALGQAHASPMPVSATIPKPCNNNTNFRFPIYTVTNWDMNYTYRSFADFPVDIHVTATVADTANNYTMNCLADQHVASSEDIGAGYVSCAPDGGFSKGEKALSGSNPLAQLIIMGPGFLSPREEDSQISVNLLQTWYCGPKADNTHYYNVYDASAYWETTISCQDRGGVADRPIDCTVPDLPVKAARMSFTARPGDFPQPLPRPGS